MRCLRIPHRERQPFCAVHLPEYCEGVHLHADHEQNTSASTVRLRFEGYVASTQHGMAAAPTIEPRAPTTCRRNVPFL
jgi:hypothetical protein